jgi:hypothetical protein
MNFWLISAKTQELIAPMLYCLRPADVSTVVGISTISGISAIAGLPSVVDACDVHIVPAAAVVSGFFNSVPDVVGRLYLFAGDLNILKILACRR